MHFKVHLTPKIFFTKNSGKTRVKPVTKGSNQATKNATNASIIFPRPIGVASIAIMVGGAVLNTAAFIGGNYLVRALGGGDKAALEEKEHHDRALEAYQAAYAKYTRDRTKLLDWIETNAEIKAQAKQNFTNTDYAFKLYNQAHPDERMIPPQRAQVL